MLAGEYELKVGVAGVGLIIVNGRLLPAFADLRPSEPIDTEGLGGEDARAADWTPNEPTSFFFVDIGGMVV